MDELNYLESLKRFGIKPGLSRTKKTLRLIGNPQDSFKSFHVTGTNGKGSVCSFIYSMLRAKGLRVGLYLSPHLVRFNERIKVDDKEISDLELSELIGEVRKKIGKKVKPTYFEFVTALAFLYFSKKKVDYAVIEVGMGGRFDSTNVIIPIVSVITHIDFDHMDYLGNTLERIAEEKAGIIKKNIPLVTAEKNRKVLALFRYECKKKDSDVFVLGKDFTVRKKANCRFRAETDYKIDMKGDHQIENAALSLLALKVAGFDINDNKIKKGIEKAFIAGRLQKIGRITLDGAHNPDGVRALVEYLKKSKRKYNILLAIKNGKDSKKMIALLVPYARCFVLSQANFMPTKVEILEKEVKKSNIEYYVTKSAKDALLVSYGLKGETLITGSLYFVGDCLSHLTPR